MLQNVSSEERGEQKNLLVSDFRKIFAIQISKVQLHRRKLQAKCAKTWKLVHNVRSMKTSTFGCKFVLGIGFIVKVTARCSVLV